jgi:N-6 DNA Methylase
MPLSWSEIRDRAVTFSREYREAQSEKSLSQQFWRDFFQVFGVDAKRVASYEQQVKLAKAEGKFSNGWIDVFWRGKLLIEMKSAGQNLDRAFGQALQYFDNLPERDLPRFILVCDFQQFRLFDLETNQEHRFKLADLSKHIKLFGFIPGYQVQTIAPQDPVNIKAVRRLRDLHDALRKNGYEGHDLRVFLVRILFCLFADDTGIFQPAGRFKELLDQLTDPAEVGRQLTELFEILNTPEDKRQKAHAENYAGFRYINGKLFAERISTPALDHAAREALLEAAALDWSAISPAIFGAMFQDVMNDKERRDIGAHYTSEENILKLIKPLFLDELWAKFHKVKTSRNRLFDFHKSLRLLNFFDPACGCGNFLVITYRELRKLEAEILRTAYADGQQMLDVHQFTTVDVDQFYGIEIEEFPAQIAQVALWLTDHQINRDLSDEFGKYFDRLPLKSTPHIHHGNALQVDWEDVLPASQCSYVLGNPPFVGAKYMGDDQRADVAKVFAGIDNAGLLDFVAAWYVKATRYMKAAQFQSENNSSPSENLRRVLSNSLQTAFVSTNSITQGEQVGVLWSWLLAQGIEISFAHRTFKWSNEASGKAAVHCVIIGFGYVIDQAKTIYEYADIAGEPVASTVSNINPYLVDAPNVVLPRRRRPICAVPDIGIGSQPIDDGNYLFSTEAMHDFIKSEPNAKKWFRRWLGADEFLNGYERWCLWLSNCPPAELRAMPNVLKRVQAVKAFRLESKRKQTLTAAATPAAFATEMTPTGNYLLIPKVSSEKRGVIPIGFLDETTFCSDLVFMLPKANLFHFGILSSSMHNAWMRYTAGRLKSDYRYSKDIVYNNFPWPVELLFTDEKEPLAGIKSARAAIESGAQAVLDARAQFPGSSLADLYDPLAMPPALLKAHQKLDAAVDKAYEFSGGKKSYKTDAERVAYLFELYQRLTSLLPSEKPKKSAKKR